MVGEKKYWSDVLDAIEAVEAFTAGMTSLHDYVAERRKKWTAERGVAIIGEAVDQLRRLDVDGLPPDVDRIVAMRNRLIHSYDNVDDMIVWRVIKMHLPELKRVARSGLQKG